MKLCGGQTARLVDAAALVGPHSSNQRQALAVTSHIISVVASKNPQSREILITVGSLDKLTRHGSTTGELIPLIRVQIPKQRECNNLF